MGDMQIRVVFMGSPDFALPTLQALDQAFNVVGVVTQPDRPAGRGRKVQAPDIKVLAQSLELPFIQPATLKDPDVFRQIEAWAPDVIVVAAFGQILRENVLNLPRHGCVNVHASLLPRWRGAAPVQAAILNDDVTGVTIMKMDKGLDTGPILSQKTVQISEGMAAATLFNTLAQIGANLLIETLPRYIHGEIEPQVQNGDEATYAPRLKKEDGLLDFRQPASISVRKVRAFNPWPGAFQFYEDTRLRVYQAHQAPLPDAVPGKRYILDNKPAWGTGEGLLILDSVQAAGKKRTSGEAFLRGVKHWINDEENQQ